MTVAPVNIVPLSSIDGGLVNARALDAQIQGLVDSVNRLIKAVGGSRNGDQIADHHVRWRMFTADAKNVIGDMVRQIVSIRTQMPDPAILVPVPAIGTPQYGVANTVHPSAIDPSFQRIITKRFTLPGSSDRLYRFAFRIRHYDERTLVGCPTLDSTHRVAPHLDWDFMRPGEIDAGRAWGTTPWGVFVLEPNPPSRVNFDNQRGVVWSTCTTPLIVGVSPFDFIKITVADTMQLCPQAGYADNADAGFLAPRPMDGVFDLIVRGGKSVEILRDNLNDKSSFTMLTNYPPDDDPRFPYNPSWPDACAFQFDVIAYEPITPDVCHWITDDFGSPIILTPGGYWTTDDTICPADVVCEPCAGAPIDPPNNCYCNSTYTSTWTGSAWGVATLVSTQCSPTVGAGANTWVAGASTSVGQKVVDGIGTVQSWTGLPAGTYELRYVSGAVTLGGGEWVVSDVPNGCHMRYSINGGAYQNMPDRGRQYSAVAAAAAAVGLVASFSHSGGSLDVHMFDPYLPNNSGSVTFELVQTNVATGAFYRASGTGDFDGLVGGAACSTVAPLPNLLPNPTPECGVQQSPNIVVATMTALVYNGGGSPDPRQSVGIDLRPYFPACSGCIEVDVELTYTPGSLLSGVDRSTVFAVIATCGVAPWAQTNASGEPSIGTIVNCAPAGCTSSAIYPNTDGICGLYGGGRVTQTYTQTIRAYRDLSVGPYVTLRCGVIAGYGGEGMASLTGSFKVLRTRCVCGGGGAASMPIP